MSSLVSKLSEGRGAAVDLADVFCPICLSILLQPVKMPCSHVLCLSCFKQNMKEATLCCPLCRARISSWARKAVRSQTLVDQELWSFITKTFPKQVEEAQDGKYEIDPEEIFPCFAVHQFAEQGDIKSEFDSQLERTMEEDREEREREEQLSSELARQMEEEEREEERQRLRVVQQQEEADRELARKIRMENITPTSSKKRKNNVMDLLKKSAEKQAKLTQTPKPSSVEKAGSSKEDSDVEINWSDEDFLEEQKQIERRLAQEREDGELARKLQSEYQMSS